MIRLTNPATGHEVKTDEQSVDFWSAAGYVKQDEPVQEKPKRAPRKTASRKRSS